MLYLLGLSYGAVSLALEALGGYLCKSQVYEAVQAAAQRVPGMQREGVFGGLRTPALGSDVTSVRCHGQWLLLGLCVDDTSGLVLSVDGLSGEDGDSLQSWLRPIVSAVASRGFLGDVVLAGVDLVTDLVTEQGVELAASEVVRAFDGQVDEGVYALRPDALAKLKGRPVPIPRIPAPPDGGPMLVFVHGTFSDTAGTFGTLWSHHPRLVRLLYKRFGEQVYALDHRTLGRSPIANALTLAKALPSNARVHLVTHSRGGLVAEALARLCACRQDLFEPFAGEEYEAERADLAALAKIVRERDVRVERVVRVACPARGTLLASKRLDAYLSVFKWSLQLAGIPVAPLLVEFLGAVAQRRADPGELPGLAAQIPDSALLQWLHLSRRRGAPRRAAGGRWRHRG